MLEIDAQCLSELARPRAQVPVGHGAAPLTHQVKPRSRLQGADQHRASWLAHEIEAIVDAVDLVHIGMAGRAEHDPVARCRACKTMRSRISRIIGFHFHDKSPHHAEKQARADQVSANLRGGAVEEGLVQHGAQINALAGQPPMAVFAARRMLGREIPDLQT